MKFRIFNDKVKVFPYLFIFVFLSTLMVLIRQTIGYRTPDEMYYMYDLYRDQLQNLPLSFSELFNGSILIKYYVTSYLFAVLFKLGELYIYIFNISLVSFALVVSYNTYVLNCSNKIKRLWFSMFLLPNVLFFSASILRDIHLFSFVILLLCYYKKGNSNLKVLCVLLLILLLRPELGLVISVSFVIAKIKNIFFRKVSVVAFLIISFVHMAYLNNDGWYLSRIMRSLTLTGSVGIWGFTDYNLSVPVLLLSNAVLFYFPYTDLFFISSLFGNALLLCGFVNVYFFYQLLKFNNIFEKDNEILNFSIINLILFIPISANETDSLAAIRHVLSVLPFMYSYLIINIGIECSECVQ